MKPKLLIHPSQARTISNPVEVERLLSLGWVLAAPKPKTAMAKTMRGLRARRRAEGWLSVYMWLSPADAAVVKKIRRPGESYAALLVRLATQRSSLL